MCFEVVGKTDFSLANSVLVAQNCTFEINRNTCSRPKQERVEKVENARRFDISSQATKFVC